VSSLVCDRPVELTVNGRAVRVTSSDADAHTTLAAFLRERLHLTGTKVSCAEGGCGACVVHADFVDTADNSVKSRSVNAVSFLMTVWESRSSV
jgi:aerobic-type carbon monoxide dehydrogenase small subunit (CoxS/CutS family)